MLVSWLKWPRRTVATAKKSWRLEIRHLIIASLFVALAIDARWWFVQRYRGADLRVTFLSVGEGDAAVIRFPGGRVMLVDGGPAWRDFDLGERVVARYLWSQKIMQVDWLVLSHPDQDHYGGLDFIARNFSPDEFWRVDVENRDSAYAALLATLDEMKVPVLLVDSTIAPRTIDGVRPGCAKSPRGGFHEPQQCFDGAAPRVS